MAHYAEIDSNNVVIRVVVMADNLEDGEQYCSQLYGGQWKQTSYNNNFRVRFASPGMIYDQQHDAFVPPRPDPSWVLDSSFVWVPPIAKPDPNGQYRWGGPLNVWIPTDKYLFANYGLTQDYELIRPTVEKYQMVNGVFVTLLRTPDYHIQLERANNILFVHVKVREWTPAIKRSYIDDINNLHREIGTDVYAYSLITNAEYLASDANSIDNLKKFSKIFGFEEYEDVVLGNGYEHFIMKRPLAAAYG